VRIWGGTAVRRQRVVPDPGFGDLISGAKFGKFRDSIFGCCEWGVTFGRWEALGCELLWWDYDLKVEGDANGIDIG